MVCRDCFRGTFHDHAEPKGSMTELYGYQTYLAMPEDGSEPKSTVIFFCDAFGLNLPNNKILADHYATKTGCRVIAPDIIPGGGVQEWVLHGMNTAMSPLDSYWLLLNPWETLPRVYNLAKVIPTMAMFMYKAAAPGAYPQCLKYARDVKAGLPKGGKLGLAGFCWGGYPATKLCGETDTDGGLRPLVDASFTAHPSFLDKPADMVEPLAKFKTPYSCAVAEYDFLFNKDVAGKYEAALRQKLDDNVKDVEFRVHKGARHGFAVRASPDEGLVGKNGYEGAAQQAVDWFNKYLK